MRKLTNIALVCVALLMQPCTEAMEQAVKQDTTQMAMELLREQFHNGALTVALMKPVLDEIKKDARVQSRRLFHLLNGGFDREIVDYIGLFSGEVNLEPNEKAQLEALEKLIEFMAHELDGPPHGIDLSALVEWTDLKNARYEALTILRVIREKEASERRARTSTKWEKERQERDEQEADTFIWSLRKALASDCLNRDFVIRSFEKDHGQSIKAAISQKLAVWVQELCEGEYFEELHTLQEKVDKGDELADWDVSTIFGLHELMIQCDKSDFKISFTQAFLAILSTLYEPLRLKENARYIAKQLSASDEQDGLAEVRGRLAALREALMLGNCTTEMVGRKGQWIQPLRGGASELAHSFAVVEFLENDTVIKGLLTKIHTKLERHEELIDSEKSQGKALAALIDLGIDLSTENLLRELEDQVRYEAFFGKMDNVLNYSNEDALRSGNNDVNNNNNETKQ